MTPIEIPEEGTPAVITDHHALKLPSEARDQLLPLQTLTITELLRFQLPISQQKKGVLKAEDFFSKDQPNLTDPGKIRYMPMPAANMVQSLIDAASSICLDNCTWSVKCSHLLNATTHRLPLWVLEYWREASEIRLNHFDPWRQAVAMMERHEQSRKSKGTTSKQVRMQDICQLLSKIRYNDNVHGFERNMEPVSSLATYLTKDWFTTTHENQMLELLRRTVLADAKLREKVEIVDLHFFQMLEHAYDDRATTDYSKSRSTCALRELGNELAAGWKDIVGGIVNVGGVHWAAIVIDFKTQSILYGDSQGDSADPKLLQVVDWWIETHTSERFVLEVLPITCQLDGHSCGLLSFNAVANKVASREYPLIAMQDVIDGRLGMMCKVARIHLLNGDFDFNVEPDNSKDHTLSVNSYNESEEDVFTDKHSPSGAGMCLFSHAVSPSPSTTSGADSSEEAMSDSTSALDSSPMPPKPPSSAGSENVQTTAITEPLAGIERPKTPPNKLQLTKRVRAILTPSKSPTARHEKKKMRQSSPQKGSVTSASKFAQSSAIRKGLEQLTAGTKVGLFQFFTKCTPEEANAQSQRASERSKMEHEKQTEMRQQIHKDAKDKKKEGARLRQQKHRQDVRNAEIASGERSPGGTKRKRRETHLVELDGGGAKRTKTDDNVAQLSRPARQIHTQDKLNRNTGRGRPRIREPEEARYVNWHNKLLWPHIDKASRHPEVGWRMSPTAIIKVLQREQPHLFARLSRSTVKGWIDRKGPKPRWSDECMLKVAKGGEPKRHGGRVGVLANYPDVVATIKAQLNAIRDANAPLSLVTIRGIFIAIVVRTAPEIMEKRLEDGSTFRCSDSFLRRWLHETLNWSVRTATQDSQKKPEDWEEQCRKAFLRIAYNIKEHDIPSELFVNTDQTQLLYAPGSKLTWTQTGSKQVSIIGNDDKRAVTLVVSIANNGDLLPFQVIYKGIIDASKPSEDAPKYEECMEAGIKFELSENDTYWSTEETMKRLVQKIISPYFAKQREMLHLPPEQKAIWFIDCWSVHRSESFRKYMKENHPDIIVLYVPGGCTGLFQPSDVGFQRLLKHFLKLSFHRDIVEDMLAQIDEGKPKIHVQRGIARVRDCSVRWVWEAYERLNKPEIIKKAFAKCEAGEFNLSYESLTGYAARETLRGLKKVDEVFWMALTQGDNGLKLSGKKRKGVKKNKGRVDDDVEEATFFDDGVEDDCNVSPEQLLSHVLFGHDVSGANVATDKSLRIDTESVTAESLEVPDDILDGDADDGKKDEELGRGKRIKKANRLYIGSKFWRYDC